MILTGSNRCKDIVQIFSFQKRQLITNVEWELSSKKDLEAGFVYAARFSKPHPDLIFAGGAGRNEIKIFENNVDGSASMRNLAIINELESPVLSMDMQKSGENFVFGLQDGRIYIVNYKIDDSLGEFEGYQDMFKIEKAAETFDEKEKEQKLDEAHEAHKKHEESKE